MPLVSRATAHELLRVLSYPKFALSEPQIEAFSALYLPFAERVQVDEHAWSFPQCRDPADHMFLALAEAGRADILVSGDDDLLAMQGRMRCVIETPAQYRARFT